MSNESHVTRKEHQLTSSTKLVTREDQISASFIIPQEIFSINFDEEDRPVPQTSNRQQVMPMP